MPLMDLVRLARPLQWSKNGFLLLAVVFSRKALDAHALGQVGLAFASFCCLASGVYAFNDVVDRERDARHPRNRTRPVASGAVSPLVAVAVALALWAFGLTLALQLPPLFMAVGIGYVGNSLLYCLVLKKAVILDVLSIVFGFFLRIAGGAAAIGVAVSHWLVICAIGFSLLLAFCKRRSEMSHGKDYKDVLVAYNPALLDQMIAISAAISLLSYMLYTISPETIAKFGTERLLFTVPFALYGVFRYLFIVYTDLGGENPARALARDLPSIGNGVLYLSLVFWVLY